MAKELATAGMSAVLLERAKFPHSVRLRKEDLRNQRTTVLGDVAGPDDEGTPRVLVNPGGRERVVPASDGGYSNNAACVGGATLTYGATAWRYQPKDFHILAAQAQKRLTGPDYRGINFYTVGIDY